MSSRVGLSSAIYGSADLPGNTTARAPDLSTERRRNAVGSDATRRVLGSRRKREATDERRDQSRGGPAARVPVRRQHRVVPDRGRGHRGRQGAEHLGHVHRRAGPDRRRQQRCRDLRPLPPVAGGRGADAAPRAWTATASRSRGRASSRPAADRSNQAGLDFYDRLVDALLEAGIQPMATLYHWDLPQALEDDGGWLNRDTALRLRGVRRASWRERLGDRVTHWCPVNEPNVVTLNGYGAGRRWRPGKALMFDALPVAHHLLLGARAGRPGAARGRRPRDRDRDQPPPGAGRCPTATTTARPPTCSTPCGTGCSPTRCCSAATPRASADAMPGPVADDLALISQPLDFYGLNYYNPMGVRRPRRARRCRSTSPPCPATRPPTSAGRSCRRPSPTCWWR